MQQYDFLHKRNTLNREGAMTRSSPKRIRRRKKQFCFFAPSRL